LCNIQDCYSLVNGTLECLLGDDIPDPGESCNVTCDDGYELTGNATRTCQDDGTWDGEEIDCVIGEVYRLLNYSTLIVGICKHCCCHIQM